jgi:DNA/RNA endonuclease G (NUC1)
MKEAQTADPSDYNEMRYDQGHMANDADMKDDLMEQINTYVMSNMSPQECRFNRGIWLSLEHLTRAWATKYGTIYVTSGGIFDRNNDMRRDDDAKARRMKSRNGKKRVGVPSHYYKIFVRQDGNGFKSISFLLTHTNRRHGVKWADVRPDVKRVIKPLAQIEDKADLHIHPRLQRSQVTESASGEDWDFSTADSNLEKGCP